jgi:hypothetical protein
MPYPQCGEARFYRMTTATAAEAIASRLAGERPSRTKALLAAGTAGVAAAVLAYRFLRRGPEPE